MEISQKVKLLKILEILTFNTDEDHPLTTKEILIKLNDMGIKCDRKTLYNDIEVLNANGYEILVERTTMSIKLLTGHSKSRKLEY